MFKCSPSYVQCVTNIPCYNTQVLLDCGITANGKSSKAGSLVLIVDGCKEYVMKIGCPETLASAILEYFLRRRRNVTELFVTL
jgi:hypothetical protein